jgi:ubiquinone/menaquinone biosynthesis C-methylase UbiE
MSEIETKQNQVRDFWDEKPCGSDVSEKSRETKEYFLEIEQDRYRYQYHINKILGLIDWRGKDVLEIGTGVGTDARNIIARGGKYNGINVDQGSVNITLKALETFGLRGNVFQSSATAIGLDDNSVDIVYSFGVLHHIPDVNKAVDEIKRVLRPGGELLIMLYNRNSINYRLEIRILRKIVLRLLSIPGVIKLFSLLGFPENKLKRHVEIYRTYGNLGEQEWLNKNTDGPDVTVHTPPTPEQSSRRWKHRGLLSSAPARNHFGQIRPG